MKEIIIGADIVPTKRNQELFVDGDIAELLGDDLCQIMSNAGFRIFNLETPLCDTEQPIEKIGPNLIAPCKTAKGIKCANIDFLTLANNHIMDQGDEGLRSTKETLDSIGVAYAGAGKSVDEAAKPYCFDYEGKKVGIYCCAEHEFTIASKNRPGANPFDPLYSLDHVKSLRNQCDYVIVLYHGGKEQYRYPSPKLQEVCRVLVEKGADLVICQHTHCVGCEERYKKGVIVYGQGNFIFDGLDNEYWNTSIVIRLSLVKDDWTISYLPLNRQGCTIRLARGDDAKSIMDGFWKRSKDINKIDFVEKQYYKYAERELDYYLQYISGRESLLFRIANRIFNRRLRKLKLDKLYDKYHLLCVRNFTECEAHRELLLTGINTKAKVF